MIVFDRPGVALHQGDCIEIMRTLPDESVDSVVTDPPYGLDFMGRDWDNPGKMLGQRAVGHEQRGMFAYGGTHSRGYAEHDGLAFERWVHAWAIEALRILKPGGHMIAFGGSRTWHRLAAGIEDAGFDIRDSIAWLYGSGFPKSLDVSKAIDAAAGAERPVIETSTVTRTATSLRGAEDAGARGMATNPEGNRTVTAPVPEAAKVWEGWGTALKPAFEPIVVARKPLAGTVAANVLAHGTGALNIGANRVAHRDEADLAASLAKNPGRTDSVTSGVYGSDRPQQSVNVDGRWPTNVVLDESQAAELDHQAPDTGAQRPVRGTGSSAPVEGGGIYGRRERVQGPFHGDRGGASRFFPTFRYEAKAPAAERPSVDGMQHPTVKPLELMRWLCRLVTPTGGVILEPFAGSGTTLEAALLEGFRAIGIEREEAYIPLIEQRITKPLQVSLFGDWDDVA